MIENASDRRHQARPYFDRFPKPYDIEIPGFSNVIQTSGEDRVYVEEVNPSVWRSIAESFGDNNYENSASYASAIAARTGSSVKFLSVKSDHGIIGAAAVRIRAIPLLKRGIAYISRGPLICRDNPHQSYLEQMQDVLAALKSRLVDKEGNIFLLRPALAPTMELANLNSIFMTLGFGPTALVRSYKTVLVDLSAGESQLRVNLHQKWRNCLNQSARANLEIEVGMGRELAERFLAIFRSMKQSKDFDAGLGPEFLLGLDHQDMRMFIFIARSGSNDAGGLVLSLLGDTAVYLLGATNTIGRDTRAGYLLQWAAMQHAKRQGCRWYDLGGIDAAENRGGYQFKSRMGGQTIEAAGPFRCLPSGWIAPVVYQAVALRQSFLKKHSG